MSNRRKTLALNNEIYQKSIANGAELIGRQVVVGATGAQGEIGPTGPTGDRGPAASSSDFVSLSSSSSSLSISYLNGLNYYITSGLAITTFEIINLPRTLNQVYVFKILLKPIVPTSSSNYITASTIKVNSVNATGPISVTMRTSAPATAPALVSSILQTITLYALPSNNFDANSSILYYKV